MRGGFEKFVLGRPRPCLFRTRIPEGPCSSTLVVKFKASGAFLPLGGLFCCKSARSSPMSTGFWRSGFLDYGVSAVPMSSAAAVGKRWLEVSRPQGSAVSQLVLRWCRSQCICSSATPSRALWALCIPTFVWVGHNKFRSKATQTMLSRYPRRLCATYFSRLLPMSS